MKKSSKKASSTRTPRKTAANQQLAPQQMSEEQFILRGIERLRTKGHKSIHTVYSGLNTAFREYFGKGADPVATQKRMAAAGTIVIVPAHGGVLLYKKGEEPNMVGTPSAISAKLQAILA